MNEFINKLIERLEEESCKAEKNMVASLSNSAANFYSGEAGAYNKTIAIVNQLAEEYNNGWIPCSERLPRIGEQVMVCNTFGSVFVSHITYLNPRVNIHGRCHDFGSHYNVIAWQPLPAPYQPKGE